MSTILTVCPYRLLPLRGGGALRCFHLLRQLAKYHTVHAIIFQRGAELQWESEGYSIPGNVLIYSPIDTPPPRSVFDRLPGRLGPGLHYRWLRRSWRGPAESTLLQCHHLVERILSDTTVDAAIFDELGAMAAANVVRRVRPKVRRIVNLYNVNHSLMAQERAARPAAGNDARTRDIHVAVEWQERHLGRWVDTFFACSDDDRHVLERISGLRGFTIPNGVDTTFHSFDDRTAKASSPSLIFSGWMGTHANQDALVWLRERIWPAILAARSDVRLLLVGGGMPERMAASWRSVPGVEVAGEVTDVRPWFRQAGIAIVPLRIGSGTRLKILEAMSQGNPVVSTGKGAEGLGAEPARHYVRADTECGIVEGVLDILDDATTFNRIRHEARAWVESRYDWDVIGRALCEAIDDCMGSVRSRRA